MSGAENGSGRRILVVEDDTDIRATLQAILATEGYTVETCGNGQQALSQLSTSTIPDLIILDLRMPIMDGWQFRVQQKNDPALAQIPVIAISADASAQAAAVDAAAYLKKPFDYTSLMNAVDRVLLAFDRRRLASRLSELDSQSQEMRRLKNAFISNISHEIRTPMNAVLSLAQLIRDGLAGPLTGEQTRYLQVIERNGQHVLNLLGDVLDLARLEDNSLEVSVDDVNIATVVHATVSAVMSEAQAQHVDVVVDLSDSLPRVRVDPFRIVQVFRHLVTNAVKFTEQGTVKIVAEAQDASDHVVVHVCDTGIGIPEAAIPRIFDGFYQVDHRLERRHQGAGLGLTLVDKLLRLMNGHISVQSTVGAGSRFTVALPKAD
ncbi:MAG TPA: hybrid sensor histidine kinase/response regulator [Polyangia bacterium]|nr:hybrid sensor histidine kinase/response regulator [Polyangia bacterium]